MGHIKNKSKLIKLMKKNPDSTYKETIYAF